MIYAVICVVVCVFILISIFPMVKGGNKNK